MAVAAKRSTLNVPIRLIAMMTWNGSRSCGPLLPVVRWAHPVPAQQTEIRSPPSAPAAPPTAPGRAPRLDRRADLILLTYVARNEPDAELVGERLPLLGVDVGDRDD